MCNFLLLRFRTKLQKMWNETCQFTLNLLLPADGSKLECWLHGYTALVDDGIIFALSFYAINASLTTCMRPFVTYVIEPATAKPAESEPIQLPPDSPILSLCKHLYAVWWVMPRLHDEPGSTSQLVKRRRALVEHSSSKLYKCLQYHTCLITQAVIKLLRQAFFKRISSTHQAAMKPARWVLECVLFRVLGECSMSHTIAICTHGPAFPVLNKFLWRVGECSSSACRASSSTGSSS